MPPECFRENICDRESKTKLSKIDILPLQSKTQPLNKSQRINASTFENRLASSQRRTTPELVRGPLISGPLTYSSRPISQTEILPISSEDHTACRRCAGARAADCALAIRPRIVRSPRRRLAPRPRHLKNAAQAPKAILELAKMRKTSQLLYSAFF